jgi:alginate production protein
VNCTSAATILLMVTLATPAVAQSDEEKQPQSAAELARELGVSGDDARPDNQRRIDLLGRPLIIGGEISASAQFRKDYQLSRGADDDNFKIGPEAKLETIWLLSDTLVTFTDVKVFADSTLYKEGGGTRGEGGIQLSEAWLLKTNLFNTPFALQAGRQQFQERREWWWDENLDAVRIHYFGKKVRAFVGLAKELGYKSTLGRTDPEGRGLHRVLANLKWDWADRQQLELFTLYQNDRSRRTQIGDLVDSDRVDEADGKLTWIGARARGRVKVKFPGKFYYWADIARVGGRERLAEFDTFDATRDIAVGVRTRKIRGWAYDVGASFELPFRNWSPYLTLGYARGSGDKNPDTGRNRAFRQTGLQGNNGKFRGLSRFRYYGEVLRPELSNLAVSTVALGVPIKKDRWIETVWHRYRQPVASDRIAGSRLDIDPNGVSRKLGEELDLIMSHRPSAAWEFELTAGAFRAGPAFGTEKGRWAYLGVFKLDYNF